MDESYAVAETTSEPTGTLQTALANAMRLLSVDPARAALQAREILRAVPQHPKALLLLASALRLEGDLAGARDILMPLAEAQPNVVAIQLELGLVLGRLGQNAAAIGALTRATQLAPDHPAAWRELGDQWTQAGDAAAADDAYARHIKASVRDPRLLEAASALCDNHLAVAERLLRAFLIAHPTDVAAIRMLAEVGSRLRRYDDAENLLARCVELAPSFLEARHNYASVLYRRNKIDEALAQVHLLLAHDKRDPAYRNLEAAALSRIGDSEQAIARYESLLKDFPNQPKTWMSYGHTLKAMGRQSDAVAAYRKSIALLPSLGEAWWSLANMKTLRFSADDVAAMAQQLVRKELSDEDRYHFHFTLGKALEDEKDYAASFEHYAKGNALRRTHLKYDPDLVSDHARRSKALFTRTFFEARAGAGSRAKDPIFIVGLPRAGSTLIEQILSSHSRVEGTMELPDIPSIAARLSGKRSSRQSSAYPEMLRTLSAEEFAELGEEYLSRTRIQRRTDRPVFVDKMPNNFQHIGLIHLILPNAKIIDARRHPLGCCFSGFKQHFARGQGFSYDLTDLGRYYADYVELMAHFDSALPGRVHRVIYEQLVAEPEAEIRRLLAYCDLTFEEQCLAFHETERTVRTASSEQVRQPIFRDAVEHWRNFEPWLGPLKVALGPILEHYPCVPTY